MNPHDHEHEPVPGLPHELPAGEMIVWQGRPSWRSVGRHIFKARLLALYFGGLIAVRVAVAVAAGEGIAAWAQVAFMAVPKAGPSATLADLAHSDVLCAILDGIEGEGVPWRVVKVWHGPCSTTRCRDYAT